MLGRCNGRNIPIKNDGEVESIVKTKTLIKKNILYSRFTEENFACLIAFIFIKKAIDKVVHISDHAPLHESPCNCIPENDTFAELFPMQMDFIGKI